MTHDQSGVVPLRIINPVLGLGQHWHESGASPKQYIGRGSPTSSPPPSKTTLITVFSPRLGLTLDVNDHHLAIPLVSPPSQRQVDYMQYSTGYGSGGSGRQRPTTATAYSPPRSPPGHAHVADAAPHGGRVRRPATAPAHRNSNSSNVNRAANSGGHDPTTWPSPAAATVCFAHKAFSPSKRGGGSPTDHSTTAGNGRMGGGGGLLLRSNSKSPNSNAGFGVSAVSFRRRPKSARATLVGGAGGHDGGWAREQQPPPRLNVVTLKPQLPHSAHASFPDVPRRVVEDTAGTAVSDRFAGSLVGRGSGGGGRTRSQNTLRYPMGQMAALERKLCGRLGKVLS
jgi:hypothetical protein